MKLNWKPGTMIYPLPAVLVSCGEQPEEYNMLKKQLSDFFQSKVQLSCSGKGKGKISIPFENEEELTRIIELFDKMRG